MSVWLNPTFRTDVHFELAKFFPISEFLKIPNLLNVVIEKGANLPFSRLKKSSTIENLIRTKEASILDFGFPDVMVPNEWLTKTLSMATRVEFGLEAVYTMLHDIDVGALKFKREMEFFQIQQLMKATLTAVAPSTQANYTNWLKNFEGWEPRCLEIGEKWENAAEGFKHIISLGYKRSNEDDFDNDTWHIPREEIFRDIAPPWMFHRVGNLYIAEGMFERRGVFLLFTKTDMDKLYKTSSCFASNFEYIAHFCKLNNMRYDLSPFKLVNESISKALKEVRGNRVHYIAKAFHGLGNLLYAQLSSDASPECYGMIMASLEKDQLNHIVDYNYILGQLRGHSVKSRLEAFKLYKSLPAPDFDLFSGLSTIKDHHSNENELPNTPNDENIREELRRVQIRNFVTAYHRTYNRTPGQLKANVTVKTWHDDFIENKFVVIPLQDVDDLDLRGCMPYTWYGIDWEGHVEDKTLCPSHEEYLLSSNRLKTAPKTERSILNRILYGTTPLDTRELALHLARSGVPSKWSNQHLIAWKAEAHKPLSRIFFMAPIESRLLFSELEHNIAPILKRKQGNVLGVDPITKEQLLFDIANMDIAPGSPIVPTTQVDVSFDIEKFSPRMPKPVMRSQYDFWEEKFDEPHVAKIFNLQIGSKIWVNKNELVDNYTMTGGNLEGYNGRMLTFWHIDVMTVALRRAAQAGHIIAPSRLATFIDDGGAKVAIPTENFAHHLAEFKRIIIEVYRACGLKIAVEKTFISSRFFIMLNDVFYDGVKVSPGLRAYTRISPDYQNPAASLTEDTAEVFSKAQGAVKAGTYWTLAYWKYVREAIKSLIRWNKYSARFPFTSMVHFAIWMITPKSFGGFGIQSFQTLVSTLSESAFVEGMGMLKLYGMVDYEAGRLATKVINQSLREPTPIGFLKDPTRVTRDGPVFVEGRLMNKLMAKLKETALSPFMKSLFEEMEKQDLDDIGTQLMNLPEISVITVKYIYEGTPMHFLESFLSKFKKARSLIEILGRKEIGKIRNSNMNDLKDVMKSFVSVLTYED